MYTRFMQGMSNSGAIYARNGETLSDYELRQAVPALFATEAHESRSDRFVPIASGGLIQALRAADFVPVMAQSPPFTLMHFLASF